MDPSARRRHLDASSPRAVVYCHSCHHEWYQDDHGMICPRCGGDIVEIISPGDDDPRRTITPRLVDDDDDHLDFSSRLEALRRGDRTPHPYSRVGGPHNPRDADSDPDEGDIEEHAPPTPNNPNQRRQRQQEQQQQQQPPPGGRRRPDDLASREFILQSFQDMLMNDFNVRPGAAGRSGRETLFHDPPRPGAGRPNMFTQRTTYFSSSGSPGGGSISLSFGGGSGSAGGLAGGPSPAPNFDQILGHIMGGLPGAPGSPIPGIPPPNPAAAAASNANGRVGADLTTLLSVLLGPFGGPGGGAHGDAVYTQEAMDQILTNLMEQNQGSNAPPPATQEAMDSLVRKKLDREMLPQGSGECTICIQDVALGDEVTVLPCSHWFHDECILHWLREHGTCPICRQTVQVLGAAGAPASGSGNQPPPQSGATGSSSTSATQSNQTQPPPGQRSAFSFGSTSAGNSMPGPIPGSYTSTFTSSATRTNESDRARERLNAIRASAGLAPENLVPAAASSSSSSAAASVSSAAATAGLASSTAAGSSTAGLPSSALPSGASRLRAQVLNSRAGGGGQYVFSGIERRARSPPTGGLSRRASIFSDREERRERERERERMRERDRERGSSYFGPIGGSAAGAGTGGVRRSGTGSTAVSGAGGSGNGNGAAGDGVGAGRVTGGGEGGHENGGSLMGWFRNQLPGRRG